MEIAADLNTLQGKVLCFLAAALGAGCLKSSSAAAGDVIRIVNDSGEVVLDGDYPTTAIRYVAAAAAGGSKGSNSSCSIGKTAEEQGQVDGWLSVAFDKNGGAGDGNRVVSMEGLNAHLEMRSYLTGTSCTVADVVVYMALSACYKTADIVAAKKTYVDFVRWFDQVQHEVHALGAKCGVIPALVSLDMGPACPLPKRSGLFASGETAATADTVTATSVSSNAEGEDSKQDKKDNEEGTESNADKDGKVDAAAAVAAGKSKKGEGAGQAGAAAPTGAEDGSQKKKKEKKEKQPKAEGGAPATATAAGGGGGGAAGDGPDPITMLDLRVGRILKAWPHPDRDKLYCEEIDLGEAIPRTICSGLREFYSEATMIEGKMVVVVANLKPRSMGSVKSAGMVMCASNSDHTQVVLVDAPEGAKPGDKITFPGKTGEPASAAQVEKKKILEKCFPLLKTDGEGVPNYNGSPFTVEGAGTCKSSLPNGSVA